MNRIQIKEEIEKLENHDCHLTPEDSCPTCEKIWELKADLDADEELTALNRIASQHEIFARQLFKELGI